MGDVIKLYLTFVAGAIAVIVVVVATICFLAGMYFGGN